MEGVNPKFWRDRKLPSGPVDEKGVGIRQDKRRRVGFD